MPDTHTTPFAPAAASRLVGAYVIDLAILAALLGITWFVYFTPLTMTLITVEAVLASAIMLGATGRTPGMAAMKVCLIRDEGDAQTPSLGSALAYTAMNVGLQLTVVGPLAAFAMVNDGHTWLTGPTGTRLVDLRKHAALAAGPGDAALGGGGYSRPERTPSGFDAVHTSPVSQDWGAPSAPLVPVPSSAPDRSAPGYRANDPYGPEFAAAPAAPGFSVPPAPSVPSAPVPPSGPSYGGSYGGLSVPPAPSAPAPGRIGGPTQFDEVLAAPAGPATPVASASGVPAAPAVPSAPASMSASGVRSAPTPSAPVAGSMPSAPAGSAASSAPAGPGVPVASASGVPAAPSVPSAPASMSAPGVRSAPTPSAPVAGSMPSAPAGSAASSAPAPSVPSAPAPPPSRRDYQAAQAGTQAPSQWGGDGRSQAGVPGRSQWGAPAAPAVRPLLWIIFDSGQRELIDAPLTLGRAPASVEGSRSVVVPDTTVSLSRTHMRVGPTANGAWIEDSFSANGTQIRTPDGRITALTGGQAVEVPAGTEILMGERRATIVYADADTAH